MDNDTKYVEGVKAATYVCRTANTLEIIISTMYYNNDNSEENRT